jgi:hypothetical protein
MRPSCARQAVAAGLAALLITGCSPMMMMTTVQHTPPTTPPVPCDPGLCEIKVSVDSCTTSRGIIVDRPYMSANASVVMRWTITTPGYAFASNGIQFDPPDAQYIVVPGGPPNVFQVLNQHRVTSSTLYYYYVKLQTTSGSPCLPVDPFILNN